MIHPLQRIRSFVRRAGRLNPKQKQAIEHYWQPYGVDISDQLLNFSELFQREAATILEIGFGMGHSLITMAQQNPDKNYFGIEVHRPGLAMILANLAKLQLNNVRVCSQDAVEVLQKAIPPQSLNAIHIFFPDPWPKKRHHKRRLIQTEFISLASEKLVAGGILHCATDWQDYAQQMLEVLSQQADLSNSTAHYAERPASRPETKFESRGKKLGHHIWDLIFIKK